MPVEAPPVKVRRENLPAGESLCDHCTAKCCRYYALPIDTPETREEFDQVRWFLLHGRAAIFVEEGNWYLMVYADCRHLLEDNRCGIYETRPQICREYSTDNCEYEDDALYDKFFETPEQVWEYAAAVFPPERSRKFSPAAPRPRDVRLPVLGG